ncbi:taste receptor type 2 member 8-like [Mantella aurantiaca]
MDNTKISPTDGISVTIFILEFIMGEMLNACILTASFGNLKRRHNTAEIIYFSLGLANACLQAAVTVLNLMQVFKPQVFNIKEVSFSLFVFVSMLTCYNFWLTAWLCVHYCVTITSFSHPVFVGLKGLLACVFKHVYLLSAVAPLFVFFSAVSVFVALLVQCPGNCTLSPPSEMQLLNPVFSMTGLFLGGILPFSLTFLSTGITASSLIRHMWKVKRKLSGVSPPNLQAVSSATRTMMLFLGLSISFHTAEIVFFSHSTSGPLTKVSWLMITSFPTAEAAIIIQASSNMRRAFLRRFCAWKPKRTTNAT